MDTLFLQNIQQQVAEWRISGYKGVHRETENILAHIRRVAYLHEPQIEALETYIFLKEIIGNKPSVEVFKQSFPNERSSFVLSASRTKKQLNSLTTKRKTKRYRQFLMRSSGPQTMQTKSTL
jgi:antirestriction protein